MGTYSAIENVAEELFFILSFLFVLIDMEKLLNNFLLYVRIDENMEDTLANVEGAQGQLMKYLNGISSNRWLMIKIFFILIVFLMIFLFFVA